MKNHLIKYWLPIAIASTIIMFTIYAVVQQDLRSGANDPQIQMAKDGAVALAAGFSPNLLVGQSKIDMSLSLAPFVIIYDIAGKPVSYSGSLNGQVPLLPAGVLEYAKNNIDDRITWQPASTTRISAVVRYYESSASSTTKTSGYIVAGRNMREIERRIRQMELMVGSAWIALMVLSFIASVYAWVMDRKTDTM